MGDYSYFPFNIAPTGPAGAGAPGPTGPTGPTGSIQPNPYDLYVRADAAPGGDGSQAAPYQTIAEALAAVEPDGVIHVMRGTYPITQQLALTKPGLTIRGSAGAEILLQAPVVPFLLGGGDETIDSLTMTSDQAYPVEFIQVAGSGNRILNCDIYGPEQPGDSSTWGGESRLCDTARFHRAARARLHFPQPAAAGLPKSRLHWHHHGQRLLQHPWLRCGRGGFPLFRQLLGASCKRCGHRAARRDGLRRALRPSLSPGGKQQQRNDKRPEIKRAG